ncbi:hypothetical protein [Leifsonia aquatica]|uniref:Fimbrial assembly protein n=2 Tax=Leifsonia aquatica TaxID=144185 RepID=A0A7W4UZB2_LEIAQ|nr:hypothetical protein [Leifsonia aquatica]MBB2969041.1 hypothetical protein [Leifsonia aquatica]
MSAAGAASSSGAGTPAPKSSWLTRPIGGSAKQKQKRTAGAPDAPPPSTVEPDQATGGAKQAGPKTPVSPILVGGEPRVSLMPPEVLVGRRAKRMRRSLLWGVLGVVLLVLAAVGGTAALGFRAQLDLAAAQAHTAELLAEQTRFREVRTVQDQVTLVEAAQQVGASTEIDWKDYLQKVQATLPADVTLATVTIDSATPLATYAQPTVPLQGSRVATLTFQASSPTLPVVPTWLKSLATLPGFADATPGSVTLDPTTATYAVDITMHINETAFDRRFDPQEK